MTPSPCYNNGMDCPDRHVGCREKCDAWQEWVVIHAKEKEQQYAIYRKQQDADTFTAEQGKRISNLNRTRRAKERRQ